MSPRVLAVFVAPIMVFVLGCSSERGPEPGDSSAAPSATLGTTMSEAAFESEPPSDILRVGLDTLTSASSAAVTGQMTIFNATSTFKARFDEGGHCSGRLTMVEGTAVFVATDTATYIKGTEGFWHESSGSYATGFIRTMRGRWGELPASDEFQRLCRQGTDLAARAHRIKDLKTRSVDVLAGRTVVTLIGTLDGQPFRAAIDLNEPHYLRAYANSSVEVPNTMQFSQFGTARPLAPPDPGDFVELEGSFAP